jgi:hypothetical protein
MIVIQGAIYIRWRQCIPDCEKTFLSTNLLLKIVFLAFYCLQTALPYLWKGSSTPDY